MRTTIDPTKLDRRALSAILHGLVVPRPVAWVSTVAQDGTRNLAPHSYFNVVSTRPPIVYFMSSFSRTGDTKDTLRNARATGEFVVNIVKMEHLEPMVFTAALMPPEEDEFDWAGVESAPSVTVRPDRVADTPAALECKVIMILQIGDGNMVFGEVTHVSLAEGVLKSGSAELDHLVPGCVDVKAINPVVRLGGIEYASIGEIKEVAIPTWEELERTRG